MRVHLSLVSSLLVLAACTATPAPTSTPSRVQAETPTPSLPAATALPSPTPNGPAHAGAPAIDDPFWLLYNGTSNSKVTDKDGIVLESNTGESYQVIDGGSLDGTILVNGTWIGSLEVTVTEGQAIPGLDPIEQQYGAQIDDDLPSPGVLHRSPNPYWTRAAQKRGGFTVFTRVPTQFDAEVDLASAAFWWDAPHEKWYQLSVTTDGDFESILTAVLGPVRE